MCFATVRFSQGDTNMLFLTVQLLVLIATCIIFCFPAGKRVQGRILVAFHWGRGYQLSLRRETLNKSEQLFLAPRLPPPFKQLPLPKLPCSLSPPPLQFAWWSPPSPPPSSLLHLQPQSNLPWCFCSYLDHKLNLFTGCLSLFNRVLEADW